jgi:hypothetical protein
MNEIQKISTTMSSWKVLKKSAFRSVLAICGLVAIAALIRRPKRVGYGNGGEDVEDFTSNQQAMLKRVREIWDDYNAEVPADSPVSIR